MRKILLSVKAEWVLPILQGIKTIEVRKGMPKPTKTYLGKGAYGLGKRYKIDHEPCEVYIYCTQGKTNGKYLVRRKRDFEYLWVNRPFDYFGACDCLNGKVVAKFMFNEAINTCGWRLKGQTGNCMPRTQREIDFPKKACISIEDIIKYVGGDKYSICGWVIDNLKVYLEPLPLTDGTSIPQSFRYVQCYENFEPRSMTVLLDDEVSTNEKGTTTIKRVGLPEPFRGYYERNSKANTKDVPKADCREPKA